MAKQPNEKILTKKHLARLEKERIQQRYLLIGTIVVLVLVVGIVLYGILDQTVFKAMQPVAKVGNQTITTSQFEKEVKFQRYQLINQLKQLASDTFYLQFFSSYVQQIQTQLDSPTALGQQVLDTMIENILVKKEADKRGITISNQDLDKAVQEAFNYYASGTPTPTLTATPFNTPTLSEEQKALFPPTKTPTQTPVPTETQVPTETATPTGAAVTNTPEPTATATSQYTATPTSTPTITPTATPYTEKGFNDTFSKYVSDLKGINYTRDDLRELIRRQSLRQKVFEAIGSEVPTEAEQVWARHILVGTEEEAKQVIDRLNKGETFDDLAKELSTDTGSKSQGGDLGWFTREKMVKEFSDAAFSLKVGEISQPVKSENGYHVIQVLGHEVRPLTTSQLDEAKQKAYSDWLEAAKKEANVETFDTVWTEVVPTEPAIPADLQAILLQIQSQNQSQGLPAPTNP